MVSTVDLSIRLYFIIVVVLIVNCLPKGSIEQMENNTKHMLQILGDRPKHRTEWTLSAQRKHEISTNQFNRILTYLLDCGYVKRLERGVYKRTKRGKLQLELWNE